MANANVVRIEKPVAAPKYGWFEADADALKKLWPNFILPGLRKVKAKNPRLARWEPEHIRAHLEAGLRGMMFCKLYVITRVDSPNPLGFAVLKLYNDEFLGVPMALYAWVTYCIDPRATDWAIGATEKLAAEMGVRAVGGMTQRIAYIRRLSRRGYRVIGYLLEKEIV